MLPTLSYAILLNWNGDFWFAQGRRHWDDILWSHHCDGSMSKDLAYLKEKLEKNLSVFGKQCQLRHLFMDLTMNSEVK